MDYVLFLWRLIWFPVYAVAKVLTWLAWFIGHGLKEANRNW